MKSAFLPLGLAIAFALAWLQPAPGSLLKDAGLIPWMVVLIFLVNGYQTNLHELPRDRRFGATLGMAALISLLIAPFIGLGFAGLLGLSAGMTLGLVVKATVPSTLSTCIVMTQLTGGYSLWALVMTIALNIIGIFTIPFMLQLTLEGLGQIDIAALPLLLKLIQLVLLPFLLGLAARRLLQLRPDHKVLQYLPSSCVIASVWMALSDSSGVFRQLEPVALAKIALAALGVHFSLMLLCWLAARLLRLQWPATLALLFTGSQKTLPVAISVLAALNHSLGEALLVCVLFHFLMLFADALLAPRLRRPTASLE